MNAHPTGFTAYQRIEQARMPSTRALFTYWQANLHHNLPPKRTDIDPQSIKSILPFVLLGDIEPAPFRIRFRLVGTAVADFSRQDFTGRYLDELAYSTRDSIDWVQCYKYIHTHHVGVIGINELRLSDGSQTSYEFALMPLLRDTDPAGSFIAVEAYDGFDHLHIPDLTPVTKLSQG
jgi:hypothetical protein